VTAGVSGLPSDLPIVGGILDAGQVLRQAGKIHRDLQVALELGQQGGELLPALRVVGLGAEGLHAFLQPRPEHESMIYFKCIYLWQ
jgi:hypothetical protein